MGWLAEHAATYRGLAEVIARSPGTGSDPDGSRLDDDCARMAAVTRRLVDDARSGGRLRSEVTADDVTTPADAAAWSREQHGADAAERLVTMALRGMAVPGTTGP